MDDTELEKLINQAADEPPFSEMGIRICEMLAERAYARMHDSPSPKDERDDALLQLTMALRIARRLKLTDKHASLQKRYDEIAAVYNAQFRSWRP